jgi:hypothetical protein
VGDVPWWAGAVGKQALAVSPLSGVVYVKGVEPHRLESGDEQGLGRAGVGTRFRYRTGITRAILLVRLFDFQVDGF